MAAKKMLKSNAVYMFVNRRTGFALQAPENAGSTVTVAVPEGNKLQLWTPVFCEDGTLRLVNPATGLMLDTIYSGTVNGTWANAWNNTSDSQLWRIVTAARGYRKLIHAKSDRVLDIAFMSSNPGVPVQIWDDVGGENQQWKVLEYPSPEAAACITGAGLKKAAKKAVKKSEKLLDNAEEVLYDVTGLAVEAGNTVKPMVKKARRNTKKTVRNVTVKADEAARELKKTVKKTAKAAEPVVKSAMEKLTTAAEDFIDSMNGKDSDND